MNAEEVNQGKTEFITHNTFDDIIKSEKMANALEAKHRLSAGGLSERELFALAPNMEEEDRDRILKYFQDSA